MSSPDQATMARSAPPELAASEADRGVSPVGGAPSGGRRFQGLALALLGGAVGIALLLGSPKKSPAGPANSPGGPRQLVAFPEDPAKGPTLAHPGPDAPSLERVAKQGPDGEEKLLVPALQPEPARDEGERSMPAGASLIVYSRSGEGRGLDHSAPGGSRGEAPSRAPGAIEVARARPPEDRNLRLSAGAVLPCILETALDSSTPGLCSCLVSRDIYSDAGSVVLIERGSRVLGEYRASLSPGRRRLHVLWTRVMTPAGVSVDLASPAADPLGRAGIDGDVDTRFWDRFGGAVMMSLLEGGASALDQRDAVWVTRPSQAAGLALGSTIGITPVLRKAAGAEVSIFLARDLDFSDAYELRPVMATGR